MRLLSQNFDLYIPAHNAYAIITYSNKAHKESAQSQLAIRDVCVCVCHVESISIVTAYSYN